MPVHSISMDHQNAPTNRIEFGFFGSNKLARLHVNKNLKVSRLIQVNSAISAHGFSFFVAVSLWVGFRRLKEIRKEIKKEKHFTFNRGSFSCYGAQNGAFARYPYGAFNSLRPNRTVYL